MIGLLASYGFVFFVMGIASVCDKLNIFNDEGSRKFIHVGVANWWFVAWFFFEPSEYYLAVIPPLTFILLNYLSYRYNLVESMERDEQSPNDLGTVYYAISLFIITFFAFYYNQLAAGAIAILAMGYGDGLGAVFGKAYGKRTLYGSKTLIGSCVMFLATLIIGLIFAPALWFLMIPVALLGTAIELFTPKGLDNLSVPLVLFLVLVLIL